MVQFEFAQMIHEDRLHKAQKYQLYKQGTPSKPSLAIRLRLRLGNLLIAFGKWLKSHPACHLHEGYIQREEGGAIKMI